LLASLAHFARSFRSWNEKLKTGCIFRKIISKKQEFKWRKFDQSGHPGGQTSFASQAELFGENIS
jgi:hypothetical protein